MGLVLFIVGIIVYIIGAFSLMIDEFKEHILWGLFGFFTQIGHLIFAICHFDKCKKSLGIIILGLFLIILGIVLSGYCSSPY